MEELIQTVTCGRSDGTWDNNAEIRVKNGEPITECICTKEDLYRYLLEFGFGREDTYGLVQLVHTGWTDNETACQMINRPGVPEWFRESCRNIRHLVSKTGTVQNLLTLLRLAYYETEFPREYHAQSLS